jgi:hypothetical protein
MKKITDASKMRANLKYEREYEKKNKAKRLKVSRVKSNIRGKAVRIVEKATGKKIPKWMTVEHIVPLQKTIKNANRKSNLKVISAKKNFNSSAIKKKYWKKK